MTPITAERFNLDEPNRMVLMRGDTVFASPFVVNSEKDAHDLAAAYNAMHASNAGLPTYSELVAALRIGKHHANMAADRAHSLASVNERNGLHGTAAALTKAASESDQAAELIAALLSRIPS